MGAIIILLVIILFAWLFIGGLQNIIADPRKQRRLARKMARGLTRRRF